MGVAAFAAALVATGVWLDGPVHANVGGHHGGGGGEVHLLSPALLDSLSLTADQQAKVKQIHASYRDARRGLWSQLHATREALAIRLLAPGPLAAGDLSAQTAAAAQIRQELAQQSVDEAVDVRNVLTGDQLAKLATDHQQLETLRAQMRAILHGGGDAPAS